MEKIKIECQKYLDELKTKMSSAYPQGSQFENDLCVYACGSLGRLEMSEPSDLDLFFIAMGEPENSKVDSFSNLDKYIFFAKMYQINKELQYQDPSKQGAYWTFTAKKNLLDIGSRQEDYNNSFTARMLLLLESKPVYNELGYHKLVKETVGKYFTDYDDHADDFYPLFLMNDILRYWYTLTMNYEYRRDGNDDESQKSWKRLKLKYARLITCFSMMACLYEKNISPEYVIDCVYYTPFERLCMLASKYNTLEEIIKKIELEYKWFLSLKKESPDWWSSEANKNLALENAKRFHGIVVHELMREISATNPVLRNKADVY